MKSFYVITWDFNKDTAESYDVMPYLINRYKEFKPKKNKPKTFEEFREFVKANSMYQWWSRCEYELILTGWPKRKNELKIDVHKQVLMNLDIITDLLMENVKKKYTKPTIKKVKVESSNILVGSNNICPECGKPGNHYGHHKKEFNKLNWEENE